MSMLDEYEESFYYDKPSSNGTNVSGEAVGMGLGLGAGIVTSLLSSLSTKVCKFFISPGF